MSADDGPTSTPSHRGSADVASGSSIEVARRDATLFVACCADLDLEALHETLAEAVGTRPELVVVDVGGAASFNPDAVEELVRARTALQYVGGTLVVQARSVHWRRALSAAGLLDLASIQTPARPLAASERTAEPTDAEVDMLAEAWQLACRTDSAYRAALAFGEPKEILCAFLEVLDNRSKQFDPGVVTAGLSDAVSRDAAIGVVAARQLLALRRVMQAWIESREPQAHEELERLLADLIDMAVVEVVTAALLTLEHSSLLDPLTGLLNRRALDRDLSQSLGTAQRHRRALSLVVIDLDGLKAINDTYGHDAGDEALCSLATGLASAVRVGDNAYRIGGDEFVLLIPDLEPDDVHAVIDRIALGPRVTFTWGCAGVAAAVWGSDHIETPASLLALADGRMIEHRLNHRRADRAEGLAGREEPSGSPLSGLSARLVGHLREASGAHVLIEQAKGVIAEHFGIDIVAATASIEEYAETRRQPLFRVAAQLIDRRISASEFRTDSAPEEQPSTDQNSDRVAPD